MIERTMDALAAWFANLLIFIIAMFPIGAAVALVLWRRYVAPEEQRLKEAKIRADQSAVSSPIITKASSNASK